jgi:hypothetical protein
MERHCSNILQNEHVTTMLLQSDWNGRMFVITFLRVAVARAFPNVIPECFLTTHLEGRLAV